MAKFANHDEYIAHAPEYAQPILKKIRAAYRKASPKIEETIKWNLPAFEYKGVLGSMMAFKSYCSYGFWKGSLMKTVAQAGDTPASYTKLKDVKELPSEKELVAMVREAIDLNERGVKLKRDPTPKVELAVPDYLTRALGKNKAARRTFEGFSPSNKREYVNWLTDAKTEATRDKRLKQAIEWMAEGKPRNWKYMKKR